MPDGQVLEFTRVTKRFNDVTAVSDFSARIEPGAVTAFLGPNGAGKTTTLRILLGQVRATSGSATIGGVAYSELRHPLRTIGSVLEETSYRPRRSAARLLTMAAKANGIPLARVGEVLALVGLENEAEGRVGSFSLGMRQRLSVAHALLGDPGALVFDEPANGLDPEGIRWMRLLMRRLADEGRTVLVSSHVLSEVEQVADNVLVLSKGHLMLSSGIEKLADPSAGSVVVDAADRAALRTALLEAGFQIEVLRSGLRARGGDAARVGAVAASAGIALTTLVQRGPTLEDVFIELVRGGTLEPRAAVAASEYVVAGEVTGGADADAQPVSGDVETVAEADAEPLAVAETDAGASTDADAEPVTEAEPASDVVDEATLTSDAPEADIEGGPSFDDILFGAGSTQIEAGAAEDEAADGSPESGVEVFAGLGAAGDSDDVAAAAEPDEQISDESGERADDQSGERADEESGERADDGTDPRSAAVSSMLAAAARAYYEDEPRDYPHGDASTAEGQSEAADGDTQWSVAATGVIDQVPAWAPSEDVEADAGREGEGAQQEGEHEHHEGEHEHRHD
ncbi:ATP-binding cassette domain-containing protein [Microbacterium hydrocarbonoxydans]|uniref:ATP-binding cassette domain-containing protein n=1 Tax=Microbacterium hydrocarbonoxydans TaxID=273678 RepID=UPI0020425885|nr:ATP-binding cassette domain-containing protein [Microbacterium hydrocarbonoxydans]MCM3780816.1 ATP-binding cassette domain-containing protein [Microbacterium hydrocarbonoxydans]